MNRPRPPRRFRLMGRSSLLPSVSTSMQKRRRVRLRRVLPILLLALVSPVIYSWTRMASQPSSLPLGVRSVEWLRQHDANWLVDGVEHVYYTWRAPKPGGPQLRTLPLVGVTHRVKQHVQRKPWPPRIQPVFAQPLRGEGIWKPVGAPINDRPPVLVTTFRTERTYPRIVAYVAWFDHTRTAIAYYPGRYEPPNAAVRGPMMVPYGQRWRLLATFNGGFTATDGNNGSTDNGRMNEPLTDGNATLVGYGDGRIDIAKWSGGPNAGPDVAWARQSPKAIGRTRPVNPALDHHP